MVQTNKKETFYFNLLIFSQSRVGRQDEPGNDVLGYSVLIRTFTLPNCRRILENARHAFSLPERRNENIEYLISSSKNRTHNLSRSQTYAYAPTPRLVHTNHIVQLTLKKNQQQFVQHDYII